MRFGKNTVTGQIPLQIIHQGRTYPELSHIERNILIVGVKNDSTDTRIAPRSVNQKQLPKEPELANCDISRSCSLKTFDTADADSDMSGLDHGHIIGTVANSQEKSFLVALDKLDDQSLLKGRNPTKEHVRTEIRASTI